MPAVPQTAPTAAKERLAVVFAFACVYIFWGSTYLAIRIGASELPAFFLAGTRFLIAGPLMLLFCWLRGMRLVGSLRSMLWTVALGVLLLTAGNVGLVYGEKYLASGLASLLIAIVPVYIALLELFLPGGESLPRRGWLGLFFGFIGLGALLWPSVHEGFKGDRTRLIAAAVLLLGALGWSVGSIASRRLHLPLNPFVAAGWQMVFAGIVNSFIAFAYGQYAHIHITSSGVGALVYLITGGSFLGYTGYIYLLEHVPVAKVATYAYVNPLVAVLLGAVVLGERLEVTEYIGMAIVVLAVFLITTAKIDSASEHKIVPKSLGQMPVE